jgi:two-component system NtrC family sensor kinase
MVAVGRYLRAKNDKPLRIVYASGCPAHRFEMLDPEVAGAVDAVVTLEELRGMFFRHGIVRDLLAEEPFDEPHPVVGRWYPIAGSRSWILGFDPTISPEEVAFFLDPEGSVHALRDLATSNVFVRFLEVCFCERGLDSPFVNRDLSALAKRQMVAEYARAMGGRVEHARRVGKLERHLDVDLSRSFTARDLRLPMPPDAEVYGALERLGKETVEDRINCGACGYETCWEGAVALVQGLADEKMCLPHMIEKCRQTSLELQRTNRKLAAAQEQLVHSEKLAAMGQLAAGVAHEINNPLGTVLIYGHLLEDQLQEDDPRKDDAKVIVGETERCRKIVSGLLNFARQSKLNLAKASVRKLLEETTREAEAQFPDHSIKIVYKVNPDLPRIELDPDQIKQVFLNIIVNAMEAMPKGGTLTLEARTSMDGKTMRIALSDTGSGITKEDQSRLFLPFFTTKPIGKGTGLGLAIAYGIVKMHRGGIEVYSELGRGTTFTLSLPMKQEVTTEQIVGEETLGGDGAVRPPDGTGTHV